MGCGSSTEAGLGDDGNSSPYMKRADPLAEPKTKKEAEETKQVGEQSEDIKAEAQNGHVEATSEPEPEMEKGPYVPKGGVLVMPLPPPMKPKYDVEGQMGEAAESGVVKRRNGSAGKPRVPTGGFLVMPDLAPEPDEDSDKPISAPAAIKPIIVADMADKRRTIVEEAEESDEEEEEDLTIYTGVATVIIGSGVEVCSAFHLDIPAGEVWIDEEFTQEMALKGIANRDNLEWKRPSEYAGEPVLFSEGSTRFDVNQGGADTCWYLSILAAIADQPQLLSQIIPDGAYDPASGVFHCKFWSFGEWVDVYVDDHLPVQNGRPCGAYSKSDPNEMWPSLMEKAFAKYVGSYQKVFGGNPGFAFTSLTAGVSEHIQLNETKPKTFFQRVHNALKSGSVVASAVPESKDSLKGLIGSHAYMITGSAKVKYEGNIVHLYRLRNPWGDGEWNGPWSDESTNWDRVSKIAKSSLEIKNHEDGEFWISAEDYHKYFNEVYICSLTLDFDRDGVDDGLTKNITAIFGEWKEDTAAGYETNKKLKNPQFMVTVPEIESGQATTPVLLQFLLKDYENQTISYRVELLKVLHEADGADKRSIVLKDLTEETNFYTANQWTYRYTIEPGRYLIMPMTFKPETECEFLVRLFASVQIDGAVFDEDVVHHVTTFKSSFTYYKTNYKVEQVQYILGEWKKDVNAGGQICHKTCATNPQLIITILPGQDAEKLHPVVISLMQNPEKSHPPEPIGVKLFDLPMIFAPPLDLETLWKVNESHTQRTVGQQDQVFVVDPVCNARYLLKEGRYLLLCHQNNPGIDNSYICAVASKEKLKIEKYHSGS
ncbi:calpain-1 catalytic subunit-like [Lineus longissimus]|uniref:calpain-1 catalytic subunit-like n=1 Tax=Lineus longissimus TaxID=88925 RepID=UPI00315CE28D